MLLEPQDVQLFYKLQQPLMFFVNQRLKVIPETPTTSEEFAALSPLIRLKVRDTLSVNLDLIQSFVDEKPAHFSNDELDIVRSWRDLLAGKYYVFRELKKYTVFLSLDNPPVAYGVLALSQPFEDLIGPNLPVMVRAVLLPFKGKIIYDGMLNSFNISFGGGIKRMLNESFKTAKAMHGIVASLPVSKEPLPPSTSKAKPIPKQP